MTIKEKAEKILASKVWDRQEIDEVCAWVLTAYSLLETQDLIKGLRLALVDISSDIGDISNLVQDLGAGFQPALEEPDATLQLAPRS